MLKMDGDVVIVDDGGSSGGLLGQSREVSFGCWWVCMGRLLFFCLLLFLVRKEV